MNQANTTQLVVCSIMVAPARRLVFRTFRPWIDQVVKIIVHTFVVDESKVPLNADNPDGYWYCAGDFCDIDEAGVSQHLSCAILNLQNVSWVLILKITMKTALKKLYLVTIVFTTFVTI